MLCHWSFPPPFPSSPFPSSPFPSSSFPSFPPLPFLSFLILSSSPFSSFLSSTYSSFPPFPSYPISLLPPFLLRPPPHDDRGAWAGRNVGERIYKTWRDKIRLKSARVICVSNTRANSYFVSVSVRYFFFSLVMTIFIDEIETLSKYINTE